MLHTMIEAEKPIDLDALYGRLAAGGARAWGPPSIVYSPFQGKLCEQLKQLEAFKEHLPFNEIPPHIVDEV